MVFIGFTRDVSDASFEDEDQVLSLEPSSLKCLFVQGLAYMTNETSDGRSWRPHDGSKTRRSQGAQAFVVRPGLDGRPDTASLELASAPGVWLTAFAWPDVHEGCSGWANRWFCSKKPRGQERHQPKATPGVPLTQKLHCKLYWSAVQTTPFGPHRQGHETS